MAKRNKEKIIRNVTRVLPGNGPQLSLMMASGSFRFDYEYDYEYEIRQAKRMLYAYAIP
jgi:hypothetical protein